jgi:hypothetical protein
MAKSTRRQRMEELLKEAELCGDEAKRTKVLEERGRACIGPTYLKRAKDAAKGAKSDAEFLDRLGKVYPGLRHEAGKVYIVYPRCYCPIAKRLTGGVPQYYCNCSVGWAKEMFRQALGREVGVKLESSVLRGDKECRLRVLI